MHLNRHAVAFCAMSSLLTACATSPARPANDPHRPAGIAHGAASFVRDLPDTSEYVRLLAAPESMALHSGLVTLAPGEDCGWHSTEHYEEMIIVLEGRGELAGEDGLRLPIAARQYGYNAPKTRHCVFNTGATPMRYIYIVAPALPEDHDSPDDDARDHNDHAN
jgi:mannose-6-phosphate isomerase-like protein (cupin superfamily)